jgi:hypothetical protein
VAARHRATSANEIATAEDVNALDVTVAEAREVLRAQTEIGMLNAVLLKMIEAEILSVLLLKMTALREAIIGIAEVATENLNGKDIKAGSQVGSRAEI